jgi:hypothetical protein
VPHQRLEFLPNTATRHERVFFVWRKAMPITEQQLLQIFPNAGRQAGVFVPVLNAAMNRYGIVGAPRAAAFIAQVGHESG